MKQSIKFWRGWESLPESIGTGAWRVWWDAARKMGTTAEQSWPREQEAEEVWGGAGVPQAGWNLVSADSFHVLCYRWVC